MRTPESMEIEGAWRCLCAGILAHAVNNLRNERKLYKPGTCYRDGKGGGVDKGTLHLKAVARDWMDGGVGVVTFEDCCESVGVNPDRARDKIVAHCNERRGRAL